MGNNPASTLLLIAVMVVAFYFLILRPQRKRQQAQQKTINTLVPGARVVTGSGLYGTIVEIGDKQAVLEISEDAYLTVLKQAISRVVQPGEEDTEFVGEDDEDEDEDAVIEPAGTVGTAAYADQAFANPATAPAPATATAPVEPAAADAAGDTDGDAVTPGAEQDPERRRDAS